MLVISAHYAQAADRKHFLCQLRGDAWAHSSL